VLGILWFNGGGTTTVLRWGSDPVRTAVSAPDHTRPLDANQGR
jgi:hypothetical protein